MTEQNRIAVYEVEPIEGQALIRRFTDSLQPLESKTTLEQSTIDAQAEEDRLVKESHHRRLQSLYENRNRDPAYVSYHEAEVARMALQKSCDLLESDIKPSRLSKIGIHRKSTRALANEVLLQSSPRGFGETFDIIGALETTFRANQGKASNRFRKLCTTLDDHKKAFAMIPSQNDYASVLCGSLMLIISAAANHEAITETIFETVANITSKATRAANLLYIVNTHSMCEAFSEVYAQVFLFYRDAIEWYMKSKTSRFFGSFNEKMLEGYQKADANIERCINEMYREADVARMAMLKVVHTTVMDTQKEIERQRQQSHSNFNQTTAGWRMRTLLQGMEKDSPIEDAFTSRESILALPAQMVIDDSVKGSSLSREEARDLTIKLKTFIVGDEGYSLFGDGKFWLPEITASSMLNDWMDDNSRSPTLWISSTDVSERFSTALAAALVTVVAAWESEMPMISHFCERPRFVDVPEDRDIERVGLIGLVSSLIAQLLQFNVDNDKFGISEKQIDRLDGSDDSWSEALATLSRLLDCTPHLSMCVLHGLNELAFSGGIDWCDDLLSILFEHQISSLMVFRILLTTSGQSRVLPNHVQIADRCFANEGAREIVRGGKWITGPSNQQ